MTRARAKRLNRASYERWGLAPAQIARLLREDEELWDSMDAARLPGESVLDMLRRTSTGPVSVEEAVA